MIAKKKQAPACHQAFPTFSASSSTVENKLTEINTVHLWETVSTHMLHLFVFLSSADTNVKPSTLLILQICNCVRPTVILRG